jgi:hypothetical protein
MSAPKTRSQFFTTEEGVHVEQALREMVEDDRYNTESSYSPNLSLYPDNLIPFVEKHKAYLNAHPALNAETYLANLRLMTKNRR